MISRAIGFLSLLSFFLAVWNPDVSTELLALAVLQAITAVRFAIYEMGDDDERD
jgi:hypothetical protein